MFEIWETTAPPRRLGEANGFTEAMRLLDDECRRRYDEAAANTEGTQQMRYRFEVRDEAGQPAAMLTWAPDTSRPYESPPGRGGRGAVRGGDAVIPASRDAVDAAAAAELLGMAYQTFRNRGVAHEPGFPAPLNPGRRKLLYDRAQVVAYREGQPLPKLPEAEHADDLLDDHDVAAVRGVSPATVTKERHVGRLDGFVEVYGVPHLRRGALAGQLRERPGRGVGGGRPSRR
ncbi:hypothetical protein LUX33_01445 [Actinomadura madurae]|uniref:hypothetical protein n=2 Tax=Actinomadura madurae TaxID=1993 RepID=UPI0020D22AD2|nr:hypothetical protein [Actinomadura madurae]MCP9947259.1 hypothetical protein [Actinomadura madurae]